MPQRRRRRSREVASSSPSSSKQQQHSLAGRLGDPLPAGCSLSPGNAVNLTSTHLALAARAGGLHLPAQSSCSQTSARGSRGSPGPSQLQGKNTDLGPLDSQPTGLLAGAAFPFPPQVFAGGGGGELSFSEQPAKECTAWFSYHLPSPWPQRR